MFGVEVRDLLKQVNTNTPSLTARGGVFFYLETSIMDNLSQWCFQLSRSIYDSEIFNKPSDWFKVWIYILWKVNFKDNSLPRWSAYFKYERIERDCKVKYNIVTKICKYLKEKNQIEVKKATHGCIISVVNYSLYQWVNNYKGKTQATQGQDTGNTGVDNIYKNEIMQEWKKDILDTLIKDFIAMRVKKKKPMTEKAISIFMNRLEKLSWWNKEYKIKMLENAIVWSRSNIYALQDEDIKNITDPIITQYEDQVKICFEKWRSDDRENQILTEKRKQIENKYWEEKWWEIRKNIRSKYK